MKERTNHVSRAKQDLLIIFVVGILVVFILAQVNLDETLDKIHYTVHLVL